MALTNRDSQLFKLEQNWQRAMTSIQAAVLREPGRPLRIERLELEDPRPDEVLVRLVASGICQNG